MDTPNTAPVELTLEQFAADAAIDPAEVAQLVEVHGGALQSTHPRDEWIAFLDATRKTRF